MSHYLHSMELLGVLEVDDAEGQGVLSAVQQHQGGALRAERGGGGGGGGGGGEQRPGEPFNVSLFYLGDVSRNVFGLSSFVFGTHSFDQLQ